MATGELWKRERESRGMTLEDATATLHISRKYLRGIEEGDYTGWPERVFSSGYIRAYAKLLSQDPEPVLSEYYRHIEKQSVEESDTEMEPGWLERERLRGTRRVTYGIAAVVVLFVGLVLAWYGRRVALRPLPAPEVGSVSPPAHAPPPAGNAATAAPRGGSDNIRAAVVPAPPAAGAPAPAPPPEATATAPPGVVASVGGVGPVTSPYQLFLEAVELTWLMYTLDDGQPMDVMLYPGDKISIQAGKRILLKLGNAGGVAGTLNGKPLASFGERGQVKEFRIGE
jgi:cytoskeleton protein RodZ